jgi:hypothetical protein
MRSHPWYCRGDFEGSSRLTKWWWWYMPPIVCFFLGHDKQWDWGWGFDVDEVMVQACDPDHPGAYLSKWYGDCHRCGA